MVQNISFLKDQLRKTVFSHLSHKDISFAVDYLQNTDFEMIFFPFVLVDSQTTVNYTPKNVREIALSIQNLLLCHLQLALNQIRNDQAPTMLFELRKILSEANSLRCSHNDAAHSI